MIARPRPRTADIRCDRRPELQEPPPDRLIGCVNAALRVADDFWWEAVAPKRYRSHPIMPTGDEPQRYPSYRDVVRRSSSKKFSSSPQTTQNLRGCAIVRTELCYGEGTMAATKELTSGQKAAQTRKRRATALKAAATRKRRATAAKAAATRKKNKAAAARKTAAPKTTAKRKPAARKTARK